MSRLTDVGRSPDAGEPIPLPIVDWERVGHSAPVAIVGEYDGPDAPLPKADVAVLTWTSAEWSALDHVFLGSTTTRTKTARDWARDWHLYSRSVSGHTSDNKGAPLWGAYRLVRMKGASGKPISVLLFKCDAHLAHPPWIAGLIQMTQQILDDSGAAWIYSIGTGGGSRVDECLGDVVVTNAAHIQLKNPNNTSSPLGGTSISGKAFPETGLLEPVQRELFFRLSSVVTTPALEKAVTTLHTQFPASVPYQLADFLNGAIDPKNLHASKALSDAGKPLLTTDYYYIASGTEAAQWSALEMDDGVIGAVAEERGRKYVFVRNVSDTIVPDASASGASIPPEVRDKWSGLIYEDYGFYTSFNGALTAWALVTATG